jgi:hypothetical protein
VLVDYKDEATSEIFIITTAAAAAVSNDLK